VVRTCTHQSSVSLKLCKLKTEINVLYGVHEVQIDCQCSIYGSIYIRTAREFVRFEVFTAVTMKNGVFWDIKPCGCCKNRHFGGT
jgi:hypothetical protein